MKRSTIRSLFVYFLMVIVFGFIIVIVISKNKKFKYERFQESIDNSSSKKSKENNDKNSNKQNNLRIKLYLINLEKDTSRYNHVLGSYYKSDIKQLPLNRFPAIVGKDINPTEWLTPEALNELADVEKNGYRTYHYQLTRGAIGCYLSHYYLAKQLLADDEADMYLILEDDSEFLPSIYNNIIDLTNKAPDDWDYILFFIQRYHGIDVDDNFKRPNGFWGMNCYMINKKGAKIITEETENNKIDSQIDAYLSLMNQQKKINIYASTQLQIKNVGRDSNIQLQTFQKNNENPFMYRGHIV